MQKYVLGFAFLEQSNEVALILKNRPAWQAGKLNGIGGKVESGEAALDAMVREFGEESGVITKPEEWKLFAVLRGTGFEVLSFTTMLDQGRFNALQSCTDEAVLTMPVDEPQLAKHAVSNIPWLLAAARDPDCGRMVLTAEYGDEDEDLAADRLRSLEPV